MNGTPSIFVWDSNFATGIDSVDEQHHSLVELFNNLSREITRGNWGDRSAIDRLFASLLEYTQYHFGEEARLMREANIWPDHLDAHLDAHRDFIAQVETLAASRETLHERPQAIVDFLVAWLGYHILGMDQTMAGQIQRIAGGATPEQAYFAEAEGSRRSTSSLLGAINKLYQVVIGINSNLAAANQQLEQRVAARTAELDLINDQLRIANQRLTVLSQTDGSLGIANRRHFEEVLVAEWQRAVRSEYPLALLLIDIDHFKEFNDSRGHLAGDDCLKSVSTAIRSCLRRPTDLAARYGGDELAVLLVDTNLNGATAIATAIEGAIRELKIPHAESRHGIVSASIGVAALVPNPGQKVVRLIAAADSALYVAKSGGRNRISAAS